MRDRNYYIELPDMQKLTIGMPEETIKEIEILVSFIRNEFDEYKYGSLNHFIIVACHKLIKEEKKIS